MLRALGKLLEGTSGSKCTSWPPLGPPVPIPRGKNADSIGSADEKASPKLGQLRRIMDHYRVEIYLVMEQDEHQSEYVADTDRRIRYISGFSGSSAFVTIGRDWAELATDSRYYIIASRQLGPEWDLRKLGAPGVKSWQDGLVERAVAGRSNVAVDPRLINAEIALSLQTKLAEHKLDLVPLEPNLIDLVWGPSKPSLPESMIVSHPLQYTGEPASKKIANCREDMVSRGVKSLVVYALEEIAWLLNLRGGDVPYVPAFKSFLVLTLSSVTLYVDTSKLNVDLSDHEGLKVKVEAYASFFSDLPEIPKPAWVPNKGSWQILKTVLPDNEEPAGLVTDISPINLRRAIKNDVEIAGIRESQLKCSASIVKYFAWLEQHIDEGIDEYAGALKLLDIRKQFPDFRGNSFETISAAGANASAPHYTPTEDESSILTRDELYLLDSGSQFLQGSTDITRTVHYGEPTKEEIQAYTLVLKGQLAVASFIFPEGTSGWKLDILARQFLWQHGLNYGHGTGHGIGSYLNIHELPLGIGMTNGPESQLRVGHFVSDEPGYYKADQFGVRLESDLLVVKHSDGEDGTPYLKFEIMTLVPYDRKLIDWSMLCEKEKNIVNSYHAKCFDALKPLLNEGPELDWLRRHTATVT